MRTLDLFSGIGGFALASHWMGWETAAFVEWDAFCQKVLKKNFPNTPIYGDITQFSYESERDRIGPTYKFRQDKAAQGPRKRHSAACGL